MILMYLFVFLLSPISAKNIKNEQKIVAKKATNKKETNKKANLKKANLSKQKSKKLTSFSTKNIKNQKKIVAKKATNKNSKVKQNNLLKQQQIDAKHRELGKLSHGDMYMIKNQHGCFSVSVQTHFDYDEIGLATYYNSGELTATGEKFCTHHYTAAHATLPLPCVAEITSLEDPKKKIIVKINDRGPFVKNHNVILDLTEKGAKELGFMKHGKLNVRIKVLKKETMMLEEHGGNLKWAGEISFDRAVRLSKKLTKYSQYSNKKKEIKKIKSNKKIEYITVVENVNDQLKKEESKAKVSKNDQKYEEKRQKMIKKWQKNAQKSTKK